MLELTPDADYQMLAANKSYFQQEESIYSNNQYAEPIEINNSPKSYFEGGIPHHTMQTNVNFYLGSMNSYNKNEFKCKEDDSEEE